MSAFAGVNSEPPSKKTVSPRQENAILRALGRSVNPTDRGDLELEMAAAFSHRDLRDRLKSIAAALGSGRVILPVLPHEVAPEGNCPSGQLPQVSLKGVTSARAVPIFSSLSAFEEAVRAGLGAQIAQGETRQQVRPLPVRARDLAIAALDSPGRMLLDGTYLLPRTLLNALACADTWVPSWENQDFLTRIAQLLQETLPAATWKIIPQEAAPDQLLVWVDPATPALAQSLSALQKGINTLDSLEAAADLLEVTPLPAGRTTDSQPPGFAL